MLASRKGVPVLLVASLIWACQSPTSTTPTTDFIVATANPSPTTATGPTGRFYTFVSTNNQPSEQREYDWKTSFGIAMTLNSPDKNVTVSLVFTDNVGATFSKLVEVSVAP